MSDEAIPEPRMWPGSHMFPPAARPNNSDAGALLPGPREAAEAAGPPPTGAATTTTATLPHQEELFPAPPRPYVYGEPAGPQIAPSARDRLARAVAIVRAAGARAGAWPAAEGADPSVRQGAAPPFTAAPAAPGDASASTTPDVPADAPASATPSFVVPGGLRGPWTKGRVLIAAGATFVLAMTAGAAVAASGGNSAGDAGQVSSPGLGTGQGQGFGPGTGRGGFGHRGFGPQDFGTLPGFAFPGGTTATDPATDPLAGVPRLAT